MGRPIRTVVGNHDDLYFIGRIIKLQNVLYRRCYYDFLVVGRYKYADRRVIVHIFRDRQRRSILPENKFNRTRHNYDSFQDRNPNTDHGENQEEIRHSASPDRIFQ
ncbi:hypothetical protein D3C73_1124490 [compost metagenome]